MNLRDITTQSDLTDENAVFAFDIHPKVSPIVALGYSVKIQWSQLRVEFGSSHRARTIYLPPEGARSCGGTPDSTLELIGAGSYKLTVPTVVFDSGPLSISVSVSLACLQFTSNYCPHCSQWRYTSRASSNIAIPAKRGRTVHTLQHMHTLCILCDSIYSNVVHNLTQLLSLYFIFSSN